MKINSFSQNFFNNNNAVLSRMDLFSKSQNVQQKQSEFIPYDKACNYINNYIGFAARKKVEINEEEFMKLYNQGKNDKEIAEELQVSPKAIFYYRNNIGMKPNRNHVVIDEQKFMDLYNQGKNDREIAEELRIPAQFIFKYRSNMKLRNNYRHALREDQIDKQKFMVLYNQGKTDRQIAKELGISNDIIKIYRNKINLKPNRNYPCHKKINPQRVEELYKQGYNDVQIAKEFNCSHSLIYYFRKKNNLKPNCKYDFKIDENKENIKKLLEQGFNDRQIAEKIGCSAALITEFRKKNNLRPAIYKRYYVSEQQEQEFMKLYNSGLSDKQIAEQLGVRTCDVTRYRYEHNLSSSRNRFRKINPIKLEELRNQGLNNSQIAKQLGVTPQAVLYHTKHNSQ